ncbi:MAG TPA: glycosyltransferase family 39 protein [Candidatus Polarisedimenticolaceae bacterium]|nr:glycosyltransferase family 39 protein [Candidatus Polarisedimenticolaceae bacterium]
MVRRVLFPLAVFLAVLAVVKIGFARVPSEGLLREDGLFPLWARWERGGAARWFVPVLAAAVGTGLLWRRGAIDRLPAPAFLTGAIALFAGVACALSLTNGGFPAGLTWPLTRDEDYGRDVPRFRSIAELGATFTARQAELSLHGRTHPPGPIAVMLALERLTGGSVVGAALGLVALGALTILPLHALARDALGERGARRAVLLWMTAPAVLLYGATCMDMVFSLPVAVAIWQGERAIASGRARPAVLAGLAIGASLLLTFAAGVAALALALVAASRRGFRVLSIVAGVAVAVLIAARLVWGLDWWTALRQAARLDAADWPAWSSARYFVWTRLMDVFDALILFGAALSAAWAGLLRPGLPSSPAWTAWARGAAAASALAFALGAFKIGETGRILMFLLPAVVVPVAKLLEDDDRAIAIVALAGLAQALVFEAVLDTRW